MKLFINGRFLTQKKTGVQEFARNLVQEIIDGNTLKIKILHPKNAIIPSPWLNYCKEVGSLKGHLWEQVELPFYAYRSSKNVLLLNLCNFSPIIYSRNIYTLHDLAFLVNKKWFSFGFRTLYRAIVPKLVKRSKKIITVSHTIKEEIVSSFDIPSNKIVVLPNKLKKIIPKEKPIDSLSDKKIILCVGSINPRKNIQGVIDFFTFNQKNNPEYHLAIVGEKNDIFNDSITTSNESNIHFLGYISTEELSWLYNHAKLYINLSFYEGFGIPNLEALSYNIPVIVSDIPVYREILKDVPIFIDPEKCKELPINFDSIKLDETKKDKLLSIYNSFDRVSELIKTIKHTI